MEEQEVTGLIRRQVSSQVCISEVKDRREGVKVENFLFEPLKRQ